MAEFFYWVAVIFAALLLLFFVAFGVIFWFYRQKLKQLTQMVQSMERFPEPGSEQILVLVFRQPEVWTADQVVPHCSAAWGTKFNQHEHDVHFVMGEPPVIMIRDDEWYMMLSQGDDHYYDDPDEQDERSLNEHDMTASRMLSRETKPAAELVTGDRGWLSLELMHGPAAEQEQPGFREVAYNRMAKLLGRLAAARATPIELYIPETEMAYDWNTELQTELTNGEIEPYLLNDEG
jgi:hypothetical protein